MERLLGWLSACPIYHSFTYTLYLCGWLILPLPPERRFDDSHSQSPWRERELSADLEGIVIQIKSKLQKHLMSESERTIHIAFASLIEWGVICERYCCQRCRSWVLHASSLDLSIIPSKPYLQDNAPQLVFVHYKQDKLQKLLAKYHSCPEPEILDELPLSKLINLWRCCCILKVLAFQYILKNGYIYMQRSPRWSGLCSWG